MPRIAIAKTPARRETALLIPEATPTLPSAAEFITVVVSGATLMAIPNPSITTAGKNVVQYSAPIVGSANRAKPAAATIGPNMSGRLAP